MRSSIVVGTLALAAASLIACARTAELTPAPGAHVVPGEEDAAEVQLSGVEIEVDADAWSEPEAIRKYVNPLLVTIENNSSYPIRVRYEDFALQGQNGKHYPALPPFKIRGSIERAIRADPYQPFPRPGFTFERFNSAPYYSPLYPYMTPFDSPFYSDPGFYDYYYRYWTRVSLPTPEMLARALPEGVVQPGGRISGFMYFQRVDPEAKMVTFRAELVSTDTGEMLGVASIPFLVDKGTVASR